MRALCASIVTAGALIGLGLTALGLGMRYQGVGVADPDKMIFIKLAQLDTAMLLVLVVLLSVSIIGIAATFLGMAYHHERRHFERHRGVVSGSLSDRVGP